MNKKFELATLILSVIAGIAVILFVWLDDNYDFNSRFVITMLELICVGLETVIYINVSRSE